MHTDETVSTKLVISGQVQGVGFRPFVYRLAKQLKLNGYVRNITGQVEVLLQGSTKAIKQFKQQVIAQSPQIAKPFIQQESTINSAICQSFHILASEAQQNPEIHIPVDYFMCQDCQQDILDPDNFRYHYPFTNCTQCGPRYTLITRLPYDRANTSMAAFPLCAQCQREYQDINNRRFQAEPIACPKCGPHLQFKSTDVSSHKNALQHTVTALAQGKIIAIKGIGGYHLVCDAGRENVVTRLRKRKNRPHKPFAVMIFSLAEKTAVGIEPLLALSKQQKQLLQSPQRPIVLCYKKQINLKLAENIAPKLNEIGLFLPYSPLHYLLLKAYGKPLLCTSGNISGEPVLTDEQQAEQSLANIADAFLHHNRAIVRHADDSVFRQIGSKLRPLRLGRGYAPVELKLPFRLNKTIIATGAQMKNTIAIGWQNRVVISPHIGALESLRGQQVFQQTIKDLCHFYRLQADTLLADLHPGYYSHQWAKQQPIPFYSIQHHHAHASALVGEYQLNHNKGSTPWLVFCWDGTGLGTDKTIWGGEVFLGQPGQWQRKYQLKNFYPIGGDKAARQSWRSAAAVMWQLDPQWHTNNIDPLAKQAWLKKINCPASSSMGRLFDACSYLAGINPDYSYEGQGPAEFEACYQDNEQAAIKLPISHDKPAIIDWSPLIQLMASDKLNKQQKSSLLHRTLASLVADITLKESQQQKLNIGLCGGVFQNRQLVALIEQEFKRHNLSLYIPEKLPINDAAISFGQIIEYYYQEKQNA